MTQPPQDWHPLYRGNESLSWALAARLEARGLPCFVRPDAAEAARRGTATSFCVWVAPDDRERAEFALQEWHRESAARVSGLASRLRRVLVLSALPPGGWWLGAALAPEALPEPGAVGLGVVWAASVVAIAQLEHRRHDRERVAWPTAPPSVSPPPDER